MERRGALEREREELLDNHPVTPNERREPRTVRMLEDEMRPRPAQHGVECPDDGRMIGGCQHSRFAGQAPQRPGLGHESGSQDLHGDEREQVVVPGQVCLISLSAPQELDGVATGGDLVALGEIPRAPAGHRDRR